MSLPIIAVPMGDPAGIGPEIALKALCNTDLRSAARVVIIGDSACLADALAFPNMPTAKLQLISEPSEASLDPKLIPVIDMDNVDMDELELGCISGMCGRAAFEYIEKSINLAMDGKIDAIATTPINKESLKAGDVPYIGHTEMFNDLTGTPDALTLFEVENLRVFFLTRHVSLRKACDMVTTERIVDYVHRCFQALRRMGIDEGTMAIAGLNPHSGEHGLFGTEEEAAIRPAVELLKEEGYNVSGPISADSVFHLALQGRYNSVLSLYHDQGHIATKTYNFEKTISITAGMPIFRSSVDHGSAFDIAGQGIASAVSMIEAIKVAIKYAPHYRINNN